MVDFIDKIRKDGWIATVLKKLNQEDLKNLQEGYENRKKFYSSPLKNFEPNLKKMAMCANCPNMCRFDCPAVNLTKVETYAPANKARIAYLMRRGNPSQTQKYWTL